ncbi:prolipoprotein diacylglyceryl transferase [Sphingomonas sp. LR60]|uniref:prolipoprotein diacylglyceryl transferase n=1 Tax=Sphingomonas sp. LR60 TaxID=3050233 RepID=UPI002FE2D313
MTSPALRWSDLGLSPIAFHLGPLPIRWYALAFIATFALGRWYLRRLLRVDGAPLRLEQVDDLLSCVVIGVIGGGRLGYATFYQPELWAHPLELLSLWHGGMSFHGGLIGLLVALTLFARRTRVPLLSLLDYVGCATPFGMILVRIANFINGELWGRPTTLPWGMIFPGAGDDVPRHPSQLYEAGWEGIGTMVLLSFLFWRTGLRHQPGRLAGAGLVWYAVGRFMLERVRQPDHGLEHLWWGLTMGQTLSIPILIGGIFLLVPRSGSAHREPPRTAIS